MGFVLGTYSISNYAMAASQDIGKIAPTDKISPSASPPGFEKAGMVRVISSTTSEQGISDIQQKGCSVVHRLNDATSFSCPSGVASTMDNVRPVKVYRPHDLDADIQINADKVWNDLGFTGTDVIVAVLDTGVQKSHTELSDSVLLTADFTGDGGDNEDWDGHGTHVSGIVTSNGLLSYGGDSTKGVSPEANVLVGKVCGVEFCLEDDIVDGIEWAESQGADMINMSLGGGLSFAENCDPADPDSSDADKTVVAVNNAVANGIVVTISSGNDGIKSGVSSPACASGAIAVGASDGNKIASFSNTGPAMDIVAPGLGIFSTYSCFAVAPTAEIPVPCDFTWAATLSGTSMSSPHVAGVVALMLDADPDLTVAELKEALYSTAKKIQGGKFDGNGRVDALAAVNHVLEPTVEDPVEDGPDCTKSKSPKWC
jgi:subtilisin family serine protease